MKNEAKNGRIKLFGKREKHREMKEKEMEKKTTGRKLKKLINLGARVKQTKHIQGKKQKTEMYVNNLNKPKSGQFHKSEGKNRPFAKKFLVFNSR